MVAWKRFPVPEFEYAEFKNMSYSAPEFLDASQIGDRADRQAKSDSAVFGGYPVNPGEALAERFGFRGDHLHAVMCVLPPKGAHLFGRSHAWRIQRMVLLDSLDTSAAKAMCEWKTTRPINTRLGPDNGVDLPGGVLYLMTGHRYGNHWISNRTIVQNGLKFPGDKTGFRIVAASDDELDDFHDSCLTFEWEP